MNAGIEAAGGAVHRPARRRRPERPAGTARAAARLADRRAATSSRVGCNARTIERRRQAALATDTYALTHEEIDRRHRRGVRAIHPPTVMLRAEAVRKSAGTAAVRTVRGLRPLAPARRGRPRRTTRPRSATAASALLTHTQAASPAARPGAGRAILEQRVRAGLDDLQRGCPPRPPVNGEARRSADRARAPRRKHARGASVAPAPRRAQGEPLVAGPAPPAARDLFRQWGWMALKSGHVAPADGTPRGARR